MREWLISARGNKSQREVAALAGVSQQTISTYEMDTRNPSISVAKRIAGELGFNWTLFYDENGKENGI